MNIVHSKFLILHLADEVYKGCILTCDYDGCNSATRAYSLSALLTHLLLSMLSMRILINFWSEEGQHICSHSHDSCRSWTSLLSAFFLVSCTVINIYFLLSIYYCPFKLLQCYLHTLNSLVWSCMRILDSNKISLFDTYQISLTMTWSNYKLIEASYQVTFSHFISCFHWLNIKHNEFSVFCCQCFYWSRKGLFRQPSSSCCAWQWCKLQRMSFLQISHAKQLFCRVTSATMSSKILLPSLTWVKRLLYRDYPKLRQMMDSF